MTTQSTQRSGEPLVQMAYASMMAALTAVGAYIHVPVGPVPIVLQNLFVLLAGLLLGSRWGLASMGIYLLAGAVGLPVFSGGRGGFAHLLGPTGGYLVGFCAAAWVAGFIVERRPDWKPAAVAAVLAGSLTVYAFGVPWLKWTAGMSWQKSMLAGMVPFLPGDLVKAAAALFLYRALRPAFVRLREPAGI